MKHLKLITISFILSLTLTLSLGAKAQEMDLMQAKQMGLVGEQLDGMIGIVNPPGSKKVIELTKKVNEYRLQHYKDLARKSGQTIGEVRLEFGRNLTTASGSGFYVKGQAGHWTLK